MARNHDHVMVRRIACDDPLAEGRQSQPASAVRFFVGLAHQLGMEHVAVRIVPHLVTPHPSFVVPVHLDDHVDLVRAAVSQFHLVEVFFEGVFEVVIASLVHHDGPGRRHAIDETRRSARTVLGHDRIGAVRLARRQVDRRHGCCLVLVGAGPNEKRADEGHGQNHAPSKKGTNQGGPGMN